MNINLEILKRFFDGKYSRADYLTIKSALENPEQEIEMKQLLQDHWFELNRAGSLAEGKVDHILHKIHKQIRTETENIPVRRLRFFTTFQRIAAILIVPLILSFLTVIYFQSRTVIPENTYAEIQCPFGVRTKFVLPDGTTGFLNSGSTLEYPAIFANDRNVTLKGEAFFDVTHDENHPFIVNTSNLSTKVLGTQFNVIAYGDENVEEVILKEGKVEIYSNGGDKLETLRPNQKLVLNTLTRKFNSNEVDASQYVSWTEGKLTFRNEKMQQVARRLARWYNVEIEINDPELMQYAFRATFIDEPLEEVLKLIALTAPLKYTIEERETTDNDVYKTKKVIVCLDRSRLDAF
nr:FecR domain-containing protein [uncultured Draconibacterium sp.]